MCEETTFVPSDAESSYEAVSKDAAVESAAVVPVVRFFESHG